MYRLIIFLMNIKVLIFLSSKAQGLKLRDLKFLESRSTTYFIRAYLYHFKKKDLPMIKHLYHCDMVETAMLSLC